MTYDFDLHIRIKREDYNMLVRLVGRKRVSEVVRNLITSYISAELPEFRELQEEIEKRRRELAILEYKMEKARELRAASTKVIENIQKAYRLRKGDLHMFIRWLNAVKTGNTELSKLQDEEILELLRQALPAEDVKKITVKDGVFQLSESEKERWK